VQQQRIEATWWFKHLVVLHLHGEVIHIVVCHDAAISMALPPRLYRKEFAWFGKFMVLLINPVPQMLQDYSNDAYASVMFLDSRQICVSLFVSSAVFL